MAGGGGVAGGQGGGVPAASSSTRGIPLSGTDPMTPHCYDINLSQVKPHSRVCFIKKEAKEEEFEK